MKKLFRTPLTTGILFVLALALLLFGSVGGARAALRDQSEIHYSNLETSTISVALRESEAAGQPAEIITDGVMKISSGDMAKLVHDSELKLGKNYNLPLSVYNDGGIEEYVRVTVYKYWVNPPSGTVSPTGWFAGGGTKDRSLDPSTGQRILDPSMIELTFPDNWTEDTDAQTDERRVFYYASKVAVGEAVEFPMTVKINSSIASKVTVDQATGKYVYIYNGKGMVLEIQADAVQTHNGDDARISSWGQKGT